MNAIEITDFFLKQCTLKRGHHARCFDGWPEEKVFYYALVHCVHGNVFVARTEPAKAGTPNIALAAIAWLADAATIMRNAECGLPQFDWNGFPAQQSHARQQAVKPSLHPESVRGTLVGAQLDSILIADVAGDRSLMPEILQQANAAWPDMLDKRLFTYRRGKLVELSWGTVLRFSGKPVQSPQSTVIGARAIARASRLRVTAPSRCVFRRTGGEDAARTGGRDACPTSRKS